MIQWLKDLLQSNLVAEAPAGGGTPPQRQSRAFCRSRDGHVTRTTWLKDTPGRWQMQ